MICHCLIVSLQYVKLIRMCPLLFAFAVGDGDLEVSEAKGNELVVGEIVVVVVVVVIVVVVVLVVVAVVS